MTKMIFRLLVERNTKKLSMSKPPPFATGPIANAIGPYGDNSVVDDILDSNITFATLGLAPHQNDAELTALLASLKHAATSSG